MVRGGEVERWRSYEAVGSVTVLYAASKYSTCRSSLVSFSFTCASLNRVDTSARYIRDGNEKSEEERREERGEIEEEGGRGNRRHPAERKSGWEALSLSRYMLWNHFDLLVGWCAWRRIDEREGKGERMRKESM